MRVLEQKENYVVRLVKRFQAGDVSAYEEIYEQAYPQIYYFVYRMLRDRHEAQDVTQEVFVSIYQNLPKLENPQTFRRWANRTALNACIDHIRGSRGHETESFDTLFPAGAGVEDVREEGTEAGILSAERSACVMRALDELSPQLRATVLMRFYLGYKEREIAEEMSVPVNTVKRRMMLAKKRLSGSLSGVYSFVPFFCLRAAIREEYHTVRPLSEGAAGLAIAAAAENAPVLCNTSALSGVSALNPEGTVPAMAVSALAAAMTAAAAASVVIAAAVCTGQPDHYIPAPDQEPPYITGYRETEGGMEVFLRDDRSEISWEQTKVRGNETVPGSGPQDGIIIPMEAFPVTMEAWDIQGNFRIYRISLVRDGAGAREMEYPGAHENAI